MSTITVAPQTLDLKLYAGDGFSLGFNFVDKETGTPIPVDGTWAAEVRSPASAADVLLAFNVESSPELVTISLTGEQVRSLVAVLGATWDLQQTIDGAEPRTWYRGKIIANQDVTR
jgi:hypothetical protein